MTTNQLKENNDGFCSELVPLFNIVQECSMQRELSGAEDRIIKL